MAKYDERQTQVNELAKDKASQERDETRTTKETCKWSADKDVHWLLDFYLLLIEMVGKTTVKDHYVETYNMVL